MSEWRKCKLGDIATLHYGKSLRADRRTDGGAPVYSSAGLTGSHDEPLVNSKGLIVGRKGTVGKVYLSPKPFWCIDTAYYILPDDSKYDFKYLYFMLQTLGLEELNEDSAVPGLNRDTAYQQQLLLPPLPEQKAIAAVLSSLDAKINLLHRQNQTLEAMAATLFRQWFLEGAQEDWEEVAVGDYVELNSASIDKNYTHKIIEYLDTGSLTEGKIEDLQLLTLDEAPSRAKRLVQHNDVLISTVRPDQKHYGIVKNPIENLVVSTGFCVLSCTKIDPHFIYLLLTNSEMTDFLHTIAEGSTSTYPSLKPSDIGAVTFQLPPDERLKEFAVIAHNTWEKIEKNHIQIRTLEKLRDTLLPKLMSGEVRVSHA